MKIVFALRATCPNGHVVEGQSFRTARIRKRTMRTTDKAGIAWLPRTCPECGRPVSGYERSGLTASSLAEVNAWRERKGWPAWGSSNTTGGDA